MRVLLRSAAFGMVFVSGLGLAGAEQGNLASPQEKSAQEKAQHAEPAAVTEPGSIIKSAKSDPNAVLVNGQLAVPGAPADSQTVPSQYSPRNAALDVVPIMAYPMPLTDDQKRRVRDAVKGTNVAVAAVPSKPAEELPIGVDTHALPAELASIPALRNVSFVRTANGILLVVATSRTVVAELPD
jgi:hypothetical protein